MKKESYLRALGAAGLFGEPRLMFLRNARIYGGLLRRGRSVVRPCAVLACVMILSLTCVVFGADKNQQFEKPSFTKGDYWVYSTHKGPERHEYVGEEEGYHVFMIDGSKQLVDDDLNIKNESPLEPALEGRSRGGSDDKLGMANVVNGVEECLTKCYTYK